jgi:hypothetical protein
MKKLRAYMDDEMRRRSHAAGAPAISVDDAYSVVSEAAAMVNGTKDKEQEAQRRVFEVMDKLPPETARKVVRRFKREIKTARKENRVTAGTLRNAARNVENIKKAVELSSRLLGWSRAGLILQRAGSSVSHHFFEALHAGKVFAAVKADFMDKLPRDMRLPQIFVVEHNWSAAFDRAENISEGEFKLPYEEMCFEFLISGKHVCALIGADKLGIYVEIDKEWVVPQNMYTYGSNGWKPDEHENTPKLKDEFGGLMVLVTKQIRAISIALEAEVAATDIVRAPHKLNHQREKSGKLPLFDYHVVKLAHRTRPVPLPDDHVPSARKRQRMHFVRGHWKHYTNHKTWTKWFLKGDPDLGFIDKEYRL